MFAAGNPLSVPSWKFFFLKSKLDMVPKHNAWRRSWQMELKSLIKNENFSLKNILLRKWQEEPLRLWAYIYILQVWWRTCIQNICRTLETQWEQPVLAAAVVTKYHRLGERQNWHLFGLSLKSRSKVPVDWCLMRACFLVCRQPLSRCMLFLPLLISTWSS